MNNRQYLPGLIRLLVWLGFAATVGAQTTANSNTLSVQISQESAALMAGERVEFNTVLHNDRATATPPWWPT